MLLPIVCMLLVRAGRFLMKKNTGVSGGQPNLHIMAIAVPPGIFYL